LGLCELNYGVFAKMRNNQPGDPLFKSRMLAKFLGQPKQKSWRLTK
jgi:hypothetical protein